MLGEKTLKIFVFISAASVLLLLFVFASTLLWKSLPSIRVFGYKFLTGTTWDPISESFSALPFLVGTLVTSFLALLISFPFSLAIGVVLGEYFNTGVWSYFFRSLIELLAGIPSVVYGFWGLSFLVPRVRDLQVKFGVMPYGVGIFTSALVLAIMIIPFSALMLREMIYLVPKKYKEAALALGATRFEMIWKVALPYARSGIFAGFMLALGRAMGETMAVTMVIGNSNDFPRSIFSPGNTMSSLVANEFAEVSDNFYLSTIIQVALLLFLVTIFINIISKYITRKLSVRSSL
ncbi:phosphate ABC transporter permease subunit PstC [PVC group bacterium (ex Bugula neritina AB1)]|nr:phosphate ABC transporter permease subunit PstC [PVC group bacterium (ex Bugula neritina AB1)]